MRPFQFYTNLHMPVFVFLVKCVFICLEMDFSPAYFMVDKQIPIKCYFIYYPIESWVIRYSSKIEWSRGLDTTPLYHI